MDQHCLSTADMPARELDATVEHLRGRGKLVRRRQVEEIDPGGPEPGFVVAILLAQVHDGADSVVDGKPLCGIHGECPADRKLVRKPVKVVIFHLSDLHLLLHQRSVYGCFTVVLAELLLFGKSN
jgi:hypothetical protein